MTYRNYGYAALGHPSFFPLLPHSINRKRHFGADRHFRLSVLMAPVNHRPCSSRQITCCRYWSIEGCTFGPVCSYHSSRDGWMGEKSSYLSLSLSQCLSMSLSLCLSQCLSVCLCLSLSLLSLSRYPCVCVFLYLSLSVKSNIVYCMED